MFIKLVKLLCAGKDTKTYILGREIGYKTPSSFQSVISKKDMRLGVLLSICNALGYTITISDGKGFSINLAEYCQQQANAQPEQGDE